MSDAICERCKEFLGDVTNLDCCPICGKEIIKELDEELE